MKDIICCVFLIVLCIYGFNKLAKVESEEHDKKLKNDIEKIKLIIEELKK